MFVPNFKGLDKYKGIMHHTCEWPADDVDFKDKKVAVIGTGASGVQVIQVIQGVGPIVKELTVFIEFNEAGILTSRGQMNFDIIVLVTGFDAVAGDLTQLDIRSTHRQSIKDKWKNGIKTYLGIATNDFPNFYFTL